MAASYVAITGPPVSEISHFRPLASETAATRPEENKTKGKNYLLTQTGSETSHFLDRHTIEGRPDDLSVSYIAIFS